MKLVGLMLCRNSEWCIGLSLRAALRFCDSVVVLCHRCTDATIEMAVSFAKEQDGRVIVVGDDKEQWEEMRLRQAMLEIARADGATHIWMVDDDEVLTGNLLPTIRQHIEEMPAGRVMVIPQLCLRGGINQVMTSGMWGRAEITVAFQDDPKLYWEARDGYDFHHRHPMGRQFVPHYPGHFGRGAGVMHLQFASERRLLAKQYLYQLVERQRWPDRPVALIREMYSKTVREALNATTHPVDRASARSWWEPYTDILHHLNIDAEPWQAAEIRRMLEDNPELASGLNDFGTLSTLSVP